MKLALTLLVRDEGEVIGANLEHHLSHGVDVVIVTDHQSRDGTVETVQRYAAGGRVVLLREESPDFLQAEWVTRMARLACTEHGADWVINGDADEFYLARRGSLADVFRAVPPEYGVLDIPVYNFLPRPDEDGAFYERMTVRETYTTKPGTSSRFKNIAHRARPDVRVVGGNHNLVDSDLATVPAAWTPIECLHFPMRSYADYERKVASRGRQFDPEYQGWLQHRKEGEQPPPPGTAVPERQPYEEYRQGRLRQLYDKVLLDDEELAEGIRAGRLVVDERLEERLAALRAGRTPNHPHPEPDPGARLAWPDLPGPAADLRGELARAIRAAEVHPDARELEKLRRRVRVLSEKLAATREKLALERELRRRPLKALARAAKVVSRRGNSG